MTYVADSTSSCFVEGPRPSKEQVLELRGLMLSYIKHLVVRGSGVQDDELQSITNYLTTVHEVAMLKAVCEVLIK